MRLERRFYTRWIRGQTLHAKLTLVLAALVAAVVGATAYVAIERERARRLVELEESATQFADLLSASLAQPLWNVDLKAVNRQLTSLSRNTGVVELSVSEVKYGPVSTMRGPQPASPDGLIVREKPIEYAAFEGLPTERIGTIRVVLNPAVADDALAAFRRAILAIAAATIATLYGATLLLLRQMVGGPVKRLEQTVDRIARGDLDACCNIESEDELGRLGLRVNAMADRLRQSTGQLRESEAKYRRIFDTVGVGILEQDFSHVKATVDRLKDQGVRDFGQHLTEHPDFVPQAMSMVTTIDANNAAVRLFAAKNKDELLTTIPKTLTQNTINVFAKGLGVLAALGEAAVVFETETTLRTLAGEPITALFTIAFPPQSHRFDRVLVTVTDITHRKRAEEGLRRSEAYLAEAESLSKSGSWAWRPTTKEITYWSQGRYRLFGFDPGAGIPSLEAVLQRIHPEDRASWLEQTVRVAGGAELESDFRVVLPDGEIKYAHGVGHPVFNQSGEVVEIIGAAIDITERKHAEVALRESEEQWKAVFENNPTMYFIVDQDGMILSVNPSGAEQLGYKVDELVDRPVEILLHEADRDSGLRNKAICLENPGQTRSWELRKVRKDGAILWVRETARAMLNKNRPVVLIVSEDITEAKRAVEALREMELQLAHANRLETMGQLTASIAHEVNQPIAATLTNAQAALRWLRFEPPDLEEVGQALKRIVRDGARAGSVIQRIRNLIKKAVPKDDRVEVNAAMREVVELTRGEATKNAVLVRTELVDDLPLVRCDRVELQQVILNLALNAIEAMSGNDGPLELQLATGRTDSGDVVVSVRDSGPGLSPAIQENLFKAFNTTKPNGLGLGLSICRKIVEAHGGRLWASANAPRGAVFQFTLPSVLDDASFV